MDKTKDVKQLSHWFNYPRIHLPIWAPSNPNRVLFSRLTDHVYQQWVSDHGVIRQVTDFPQGVNRAYPTSDGRYAWFFSHVEGEYGVWVRQDIFDKENFEIPVAQTIGCLRGAIASKGGVLSALYNSSSTIVLRLSDGENVTVSPVYELEGDWELRDANLESHLAVLLSNENDSTAVLIDLFTGGHQYFEASKINDVVLNIWSNELVITTNEESAKVIVYDFFKNTKLVVNLPSSDVSISSFLAKYIILRVDAHGRSQLCVLSLENGELNWLDTPRGSIPDFTVTPEGDLCYLYSNMTTSFHLRIHHMKSYTDERHNMIPIGNRKIRGISNEIWVPGSEGNIHVFITKPIESRDDNKRVFLIHGGPHWADFDEYSPVKAAWVDAGYTVVQINYRGSLTYGAKWKESIYGRAGIVEIEDIMSVKAYLDHQSPSPSVIVGESWGGLIALLTIARYPEHWQSAIVHAPVADPIANYYEETTQLQDFDHLLFGGPPATNEQAYRNASPIECIKNIRCPVMVISGQNDEKCGPRQIESFVSKLRIQGGTVVHLNTSTSHMLVDTELRIQIMSEQLAFIKNPRLYVVNNPEIKNL